MPTSPDTPISDLVTESRARLAGRRVLLVEDNPVNQEVALGLLDMIGVQVELAETGEAAVAMARLGRCELILLDMQLPGIDGIEAARQIRSTPGLARAPIIAMTAHAGASDRAACAAAGMDDHLVKPIDVELLYLTLTRWLTTGGETTALPVTSDRPGVDPIDGLDTARGLAMFAGNAPAYRRALEQFVGLYGDGAPLLQVRDGGAASLLREVHSIGGAAAAIGAIALAERAAALESMLRLEAASGRTAPGATAADELRATAEALAALTCRIVERLSGA